MKKQAYLHWNGGHAYVNEYPSQRQVACSPTGDHEAAIRRANRKGYDVRVYGCADGGCTRSAVRRAKYRSRSSVLNRRHFRLSNPEKSE